MSIALRAAIKSLNVRFAVNYEPLEKKNMMEKKFRFQNMEWESAIDHRLQRQVDGKNLSLINIQYEKGCLIEHHKHPNEQVSFVLKGCIKATIEDREYELKEGDSIIIPPNTPHSWEALEDSETLEILSPSRHYP